MATEFAWVIEKGAEPWYYAPTAPGEWTKDHLKACRFARREDAEAIQFCYVSHGPLPEYDTRVCERGWDDGQSEVENIKRFAERLRMMMNAAADRINASR